MDNGDSSRHSRVEASPAQYVEWGQRVLRAHDRIRSYVTRTAIEDLSEISAQDSVRVFAKMENRQETGSFKLRGATNKIRLLTPHEASAGIIAASNGNHGLGVAAAAETRGSPCRDLRLRAGRPE